MARKRISKTAAVREFLGSDMKNAAIVDAVKTKHKLAVTPAYVAVIKSQSKKKSCKPKASKPADSLAAAVNFVRVAGSIQAAKDAPPLVDEIWQLA